MLDRAGFFPNHQQPRIQPIFQWMLGYQRIGQFVFVVANIVGFVFFGGQSIRVVKDDCGVCAGSRICVVYALPCFEASSHCAQLAFFPQTRFPDRDRTAIVEVETIFRPAIAGSGMIPHIRYPGV